MKNTLIDFLKLLPFKLFSLKSLFKKWLYIPCSYTFLLMKMATRISHPLFMIMCFTFWFAFEIEEIITLRLDLYQRDSYGSPFYNSSHSKSEIIRRAAARSVSRSNPITLDNSVAKLVYYRAEYLLHIRLGTPPVDVFALMDTGSHLTWIQCQPCILCVPQITPLFNPPDSSSYEKISCGPDKPCPSKSYSQCGADGFCHYNSRYGDGSSSKGFLSKETMRMGSTSSGEVVEIPNFIFGCGNDNEIKSGTQISAVIGLGAGPYSMVTQLGSHSMQKFAYCLIPLGSKDRFSHVRFGPTASVQGPGTITIPLVHKHTSNLYFVTLEAFTIGRTRVKFASEMAVEEGNIVIDSGTSMSTLPKQFFNEMKHVVITQTSARPVPDPRKQFGLCYQKDKSLQLPNIVANFRGGDVPLKWYNAFVSVDEMECLAFKVSDDVPIYGSVAQQDFIVGYDRLHGTISFRPFKCSDF